MRTFPFSFSLVFLSCLIWTIGNGKAQNSYFYSDTTIRGKMQFLHEKWPEEVKETSGIAYFRNRIWTINDSGNEPILYAICPKDGQVKQRITIANQPNQDWEELTQDAGFFFIGDFGNNSGARKDQCILRIPKGLIPEEGDARVDASFIRFQFENQVDFQPTRRKTPFDCEAMVIQGDSLYLFTKDWENNHTRQYRLPIHPGEYVATLVDSFPINGLVTGAIIHPEDSTLFLLGYSNYLPFIQVYWNYSGAHFLKGKTFRIHFPEARFYQTEGICVGTDQQLWISTESSAIDQALLVFPLSKIRIATQP